MIPFREQIKQNKVLPKLEKSIPKFLLNTGLIILSKKFNKNFHQLLQVQE